MKNVFRLIKLPTVKLHKRAKVNQGKNVHRCRHCLELSTFRVAQFDGVNRLACVMCLNSTRYFKHKKISQHEIVFKGPLTWRLKLERQYIRIRTWFKGNHVYAPFGIRHKKLALLKEKVKQWLP